MLVFDRTYKILLRLTVATLALTASVIASSHARTSATAYGVSYYISPPLVQNSYVTTGALVETFNSGTNGTTCTGIKAIGTITGTCSFSSVVAYGGATTETSNPTAGGTSSIYATGGSGSPTMTFSFTGPQRYLGFWWSAGSASNTVKFFSGSDEVLSLTTADLMTLLGSAPGGSYGNTGSVTAVNGSTYMKHRYFGHPRGYSQISPTSASSVTSNEPFTYLHVFAAGGLTFDRVTLSGAGFEFDNFMVSNVVQTPASSLVLVNSITGTMPASAKVVTFNANGGTGSMQDQVAIAAENLSPNSFDNPGHAFLGWSTSQNGSVNDYVDGASYDFLADTTLHARWAPIAYNVTYDEQGGSSVTDTSYTIGSTVTLPAAPTKSNFTFGGWFVSSSGGNALGATYAPPGTGDITLSARWIPINYNVTYDEQGGSSVTDTSYTIGSTVTLPAAPTKSNFTFGGWFVSSSGGNALGASYAPPGTGNITLYAQWSPVATAVTTTTVSSVKSSGLPTTGRQVELSLQLALLGIALGAALLQIRRQRN